MKRWCRPHFLIYFHCEVGFSKVRNLRRPSHSAAWVTLCILLSRGLGADGLSAWLMTSPQPHSVCLPCLPGSPAEPCSWFLTTVAADTERLHCKFQGHSPCTHTPLSLVHWRQPQGTACLKHSKTPPGTAYTPASEDTQLSGENWAWALRHR